MEKSILPSLRESAGQENPKWSQHNKVPEAIHQCVHELIKIKAQIRTDAPAICAWDGHMTYGELDELSTKLAGHLVQLGVKPESFVPLCFEKSMWIVVAMLAVLKAGGAFVPLDPDTPARHNNIFQQTNATVALVSTKQSGLRNWPGHTVTINRDVISQLPERVVSSAAEPKNAAYAIFTSGSTGVPKGVVMEHLAVSTSCINHGHEFGFTISTRALQFASYTFDACIAEIITTLLFGGCICIPSDFDRRNDLVKAINTMSVNWTFLTPSVARLLDPGALPSLQTLVLGGERVTFEEWKRWSNIETMNGYGPTECCVFCVGYVREGKHTSLSKEFKSGTIGQPIASLNWLVDPEDHNRLVPHGSIGEILVEGPILARGYLNDTQKTDTSFINDPVWLLKRGRRGRIYKTGDLARYDAYDNLVYVGRKDDGQIKVRGQRVELGEIEHHLRQYDSTTKDAIVEVIKSDAGDEKSILAAFICLEEANFIEYHIAVRDGKEFTLFKSLVEAIENHLEQVLPSHMVPTMYIPIDRVPMTTSGKTDRKKLRELGASFSSQQLTKIRNLCNDENQKTETEMEDRLRTIWAQVLNLQPSDIRLEDSLLRLGGDSISAMQVVSLCRADEITLTTQDIVKEKNIRSLAQLATTNLTKKVDFKSLEEEQINIPFELSPIQQMYIQAFPTQDHVFDQCFYLKLSMPVAPSVILSALETVVERHAMLRARIKQQADGTWSQSITDDIFGSLRWQNHRLISEESIGSIIAGSRESLDFENGPVLAADLFETDSGQRFFVTITHLFVDLISWRIILQDIEQLILTGSTRSSQKMSFPSWCELQRTFAQSQLAPKFVLPFKIQPPMTSYWGIENHSSTWSDISKQEFSLDPQATALILGRANAWLRTEPVELFLAGLVHSFGDIFQDRNVPTMFNEGHGREPWNDQIDLSSTVGWFTTLSPLDSAATKSVNLADTIRRTKDSRRSLPYKGWGYFASRFHNPEGIEAFEMQAPAEVLVNYQGLYQQFEREDALFRRLDAPNDQDLDVSRQGGRFATFVVSIAVVSGKAIVSFMYNRHINHQDRISQWIEHYRNTMQGIVTLAKNASPMYTLHDFPKAFHDYDSLDQFSSKTLPQLGISRFEDVEDVYRCSEMQQAILMNQILQPRNYWVRGAFQVAAAPGKSEICVTRLRRAWQAVVKRHAALRTTFALELPGIPGAVQIVLRNRCPGFEHVQVKHAATTVDLFSEHVAASRAQRHGLEHHLSIYELPDNSIYGILEINHAIVDGHSITLLYRDLIIAYSETQKFTTPPLYSDFISTVQQEDPDKYLHYWKNYLHGVEPCLLPTKTIPDIDEGSDEVLRTHMRIEDMAALRSFCYKYELTLFSIVQVSWAVILGMFSNTINPCFGYLSSGRHLPIDRINDLVGPTINMLTCRADVRSSLYILETLQKVQSDNTESSANQLCSLASVHHALQLGGRSLFNTAISYQRYGDDLVLHGEEIAIRRCEEHDPSEYDLVLHVDEHENSFDLACGYHSSKISSFQAVNLLSAVSQCIRAIVANPAGKLGDLNLMSQSGLNQLVDWNSRALAPTERCLHHLIRVRTRNQPDAPAICGWDGHMTYGRLDELSSKLAGYLVNRVGIAEVETLVPLYFEKSIWTIVAMLAVLKAGGAFVLLDPNHPASRHEEILRQIKTKVILVSARHSAHWSSQGRQVVTVSEASIYQLSKYTNLGSRATPSNAAYVVFTSGSTGVPKGVVIDHQAVSTGCIGHGKVLNISDQSRVLQFASYSFDACITEIITTLVYGGCVCVPSESDRSDLIKAFSDTKANWVLLTPSVARLLQADSSLVPSLRTLVLGGEKVSADDWNRWAGTGIQIMNAYGPSECCVVATSYAGEGEYNPGTIGTSISSVSWVVDPNNHHRLAPLGSIGELLLEGPILARGYLNDTDKTASAFIHNPAWLEDRESSFYKTGDLVRYDPLGNLVYVGRKDSQIKVRGQRVELEEIERCLYSCMPGVNQLAVEVISPSGSDKPNKSIIAAFLQMDDEATTDKGALSQIAPQAAVIYPSELDKKLEDLLPSYMVPTIYFSVARLPMMQSGKTDRRQLREIGASFSARKLAELRTQQGSKRLPTTEMQRTLQQLWARLLNIEAENIGMDDSFFRLGGDSIVAMQLSSSMRKVGITLSTKKILEKKTIAQISRHIRAHSAGQAVLVAEDKVNTPFGLTPIQQLYFQCEKDGPGSFDQTFFLELRKPVQFEKLQKALLTLVQRHSMLRARFAKKPGEQWHQYISDNEHASFTVEHVLSNEMAVITPHLLQSRTVLDAEKGPVLAAVHCDGGQRQKLFMAIHHLVVDLVSWRVLLEELEDLLLDRALPHAPSISFQAWHAAQAKYITENAPQPVATAADSSHLSYWGIDPVDVINSSTVSEQFVIGQEATSALLGSCNETFSTHPMELMIAALMHSFAVTFTDREVPSIFNETHGRETWDDSVDLTRTVGWFTSMFPVHVSSSVGRNLVDAIRWTKDCIRSFKDNGRSYLESQFADESTADRFLSGFPAEVMFNYQGLYQQLERTDTLFKNLTVPEASEPAAVGKTRRFSLFEVLVGIDQGCMSVTVVRPKIVKHQQRISDLIQHFNTTLTEIPSVLSVTVSEWTLSDLPLAFDSYVNLDHFCKTTLPDLGVRSGNVEDVFPCSAMQEGILASQIKDADAYWHCFIWEVAPKQKRLVDVARLRQAWKAVVQRHSMLRTLLVGDVPGSSGIMNIVLKNPEPSVSFFTDSLETMTVETFRARHNPTSQHVGRLQHHLSICQLANQKVYISLDINHAIVDAHSRGIVTRDIQRAYDLELDPYGISFKDVIAYQKEQSQEEASSYWSQYLDGVEPCHFPSIAPTKEEKSRVLAVNVPDLDASAIQAFCQTWEITPATVIQSAWALVLSRYTDSMTPCFGNLASGRDLPIDGVDDIFGPLMAMLACRINIHDQLTVLEALKSVQIDYLNSLTHQTFSLASMHSLLKLGTSALFNTALSLQRVDDTEVPKTSSIALDFQEGQDMTEYDIAIGAAYGRNIMQVSVNFKTTCIDAVQANRVAQTLSKAIKALTTNTASRVVDLDLTTDHERQELWQWNQNVPLSIERCLHDVFAEQVEARPQAQAICAWDGEMTYAELDSLSSRLAIRLVKSGVQNEEIVPLCFEKSMWTVVAVLAVLKAGGAFLLLDPSLPAERLALMCRKAKSARGLASKSSVEVLKNLVQNIFVVNRDSLHKVSIQNEQLPTTPPWSTAYVIFTSGSTGEPKGCRIEHRSSCSAIHYEFSVEITSSTRVLQFGSYSFAGAIAETLGSLLNGGCLCIPSEEDRRFRLTSAISQMGATWAFLTPTVLDTIGDPELVPSLKLICVGGEPLRISHIQQWGDRVHLRQTYGSSETSGFVSSARLTRQNASTAKDVGKALTGAYWVVDPHNYNCLTPLGAPGEVLIEGPVLGREYIGEEEKTASTFIQAPEWRQSFDGTRPRLYKTGDLARYKTDGSIEILGRKDTQVKLRGQRIELGEIEHQARQSRATDVTGLAVELIRTESKGNMLACFMTFSNSSDNQDADSQVVSIHAIRERLEKFLPLYMVPTLFVPLEQLPKTSSQKINRRRLREIGASFTAQQLMELQMSSQGPREQPTTGTERTIQQLWARVLDINPEMIGLDDNFFRLGGDSIGVMKLVIKARKEGLHMSSAIIFHNPVLRALANLQSIQCVDPIENVPSFSLLGEENITEVCKEVAETCGFDPSLVEDVYPCSPLQEGLMSLTSKRSGDYVMQSVLELRADINEAAFKAAWEHAAQSIATLRTRIVQHSRHGLVQVVMKENIEWTNSSSLSNYLAKDKSMSMGLAQPLTRYCFIKELQGQKRWFVWTIHHALYDGWSLPYILKAVGTVYDGASLEEQPQFNMFMKHLAELNKEMATAYWLEALSHCNSTIFPSLPSIVEQPVADMTIERQCPPLSKAIHSSDTTISTLIRAAWAVVAGRFTHSRDIVFGATVSGRHAAVAGIEAIVGPTIATVPVRIQLKDNMTVHELLRVVQQQATEMIPFEQTGLHDIAKIGTDAQHACSFQTLLVVQPGDEEHENTDKFGVWQDGSDLRAFTTYVLMLQCTLTAEGIKVTASFDARVVQYWMMEKILDQFSFIMKQLAGADSRTKVADISTTTPEDRQEMWQWNQKLPAAVERCIHDLFAEQARARTNAPAVCAWDGEMTYGELDALSSRLAGHLMRLGVKREDIVPLCFEKSMWIVVAIMGVLKAGGAFLLLDPSLPTERLAFMCRKAGSTRALASEKCSTVLNGFIHSTVVVNKHSIHKMPKCKTQLAPALPTDTAYIIFTSGSTGQPKGCRIEHRSSCSAVIHHGPSMQVSSSTRVLQFGSYSFAGCLVEMLHSLIHGACTCIPSEEERRTSLASAMSRMAVNWAFLTPTVLDTIGGPESVPSLATLCIGGEPIRASQIQLWEGHVHLRQTYGSSETAGVISSAKLTRASTIKDVGKATTAVYWVVDASDHALLAPLGVVGELLVEGPVLCREYIDDEERTASTFIQAPEWRQSFDGTAPRLYKTGDLARYKADGSVELLGRKDNQVKLRGQRIELGEIEHQARLSGAAEVKDLVVELIRPESKDDMLACFIAMEHNQQCPETIDRLLPAGCVQNTAQRIRRRLEQFLPQYMVPALFVPLAQLPTTSSQKVDRKRLREIGASLTVQQLAELQTLSQGPKQQPTTEAERQMQQLWAQVLNIAPENIGLDDNFFRLGGDSISAMKLVGEARRVDVQLSVADLFNNPELVDLASKTKHSDGSFSTTIRAVKHVGPVEQSFAQARLWFLEQLYPGLNWYLIPFTVRIKGPLQLAALQSTLLAIEQRHETLRTTFATHDGISVQMVRPFSAKHLTIIDLPPYEDEHERLDVVRKAQMAPFDLETEPGWRASVYRLGKEDFVLSIVMHHIVSDGWSIDILTRELETFYSVSLQGQDPLSYVQPLPVQYRDFSVWQKQQSQIDEHEKQLDYWLTQLQTSRPAELLCDKPRPAHQSGDASVKTMRIGGPLHAKLQHFCKLRGVTTFVALLAAFRTTHFRLTGQDDATIGTVNANRDLWELREMIGFFVNMQCLRTTVEDESFNELVQKIQAITAASLANQNVPFESLVSKLKIDRDLSRHPLVQLVFVVHSQQDLGELRLEGVQTESLHDGVTSRFDLEIHFFQLADGLKGNIVYSTDLFAPETIDNLILVFQNVLEGCLREPNTTVKTLPLLAAKDYERLHTMGLLKVEKTLYPRDLSVIDVFRIQASACPSRIAVKDSLEQMTYAQLDGTSDVLAEWLSKQSLAPETLVGVLANRRCQTIVAFLGIMKANLAYLPFDVKIPGKRIEAILATLSDNNLVLLGADVRPPINKSDNVKFVNIAEAIAEQTSDGVTSRSYTKSKGPSATNLAYVMFTSGSTGQPKGVMIEHRGIMRLVKGNTLAQHMPRFPTMAHLANLAFDASTWEIYATLLHGGTLICIDTMAALNPVSMLQIVSQNNIQTALLTPALFRQYVAESPAVISALVTICVGGEALHPEDYYAAKTVLTGKLVNCYGPTENTVCSTIFVLPKDDIFPSSVPIGRAFSNSGAYVMDSKLQLVPLGVIGELVITGDGLARGYTDPKQNIDRFVSITMAGQTVRAYRSGDYVRYRPVDGQIEFFRRIDGQVKIRGQRVELAEIEHALRSHQCVSDAVVVLQHCNGKDVQISGFVVIHEDATVVKDEPDGSDEAQHVDTWQGQFDDDFYTPIDNIQPETIGRDFVGWTSMYDGSLIDKGEMNEWLDDAIAMLRNGHQPSSVLEIGSGTGMILFNLGSGLQKYVGLDPSRSAVEFVTKTAKSIPSFAGKVSMVQATAADVPRLKQPINAELVIMNSVLQYFPSQDYLFKVVQDLLKLKGVRTIFFGDVRNNALYQEFLTTRALVMTGNKATKEDLRRMMADMGHVEREFLVDPGFFSSLPGRLPGLIDHVEVLPKRMKATNELSCYRFAAVIHVRFNGGPEAAIRSVPSDKWIDFAKRGLDRKALQEELKSLSDSNPIAIGNIPYSKTLRARLVIESLDDEATETPIQQDWLSSVQQKLQGYAALAPVDLMELAQESGCRVEFSCSRQHSQRGGIDAIFHRYEPQNGTERVLFRFPTDHQERPVHTLTNKPLQQQMLQKTQQQLYQILEARLPAYMVPQTITVLDAMPINQNGKVDRKLLAERKQEQEVHRGVVKLPQSVAERKMQQLWAQVLGIDSDKIGNIGLDDSFFQLGGDSIGAMRLVSEARRVGLELSVAELFRHPVLRDLAMLQGTQITTAVEDIPAFSLLRDDVEKDSVNKEVNATAVCEEVAAMCNIKVSLIEDVYPCSPLQGGLMSLTSKRAGDYVLQSVLELRSDVEDEDAFRAAWEQIVQSTTILRTRIVQHSRLGLLQAVVAEDIRWMEAETLEEYLEKDRLVSMGLGDQLTRYALIRSQGKRWFVWTIHHALYDGWSMPQIIRTVTQMYRGTVSESMLASQPNFNAFIKYIGQQDEKAAELYWQSELADCEATLFPLLPSTVKQPAADTTVEYQCQLLNKTVPNVTTSTLIRAAWGVIASRYTHSDDVVFGTTVTGRNAPVHGIDAMLGPTIATVPLRIRVQSEQSVFDLLNGIQDQATEMIAHEQTGLYRIAKMGSGPRHACGFQTLLVVQPGGEMFAAESLGEWRGNSKLQDFTSYALMLQCKLEKEGVRITASFDARIVERWVVEKMLQQFNHVLQQLGQANPDGKVEDIDTLTPQDRQELWAHQEMPPAVERCIHDVVAEQGRKRPEAPAICAWDGNMTYGELDELSTKLARHLAQRIKREDVVPLCFEKSMWTVVAILAVLKAGGAFLLLDPSLPTERLGLICRKASSTHALVSEACLPTVVDLVNEVIVVSRESLVHISSKARRYSIGLPSSMPTSTAYVIFTSGSTGEPKGCRIEHRSSCSAIVNHGPSLQMDSSTRVLQFGSYSFAGCLVEVLHSLLHGSCICIPSEDDRRAALAETMTKMNVNWAFLTPIVLESIAPEAVPSLTTLCVGGESIRASQIELWGSRVHLRQTYGSSEVSGVVSSIQLGGTSNTREVGKASTGAYWIVDPSDTSRLAPLGAPGELLVEGPVVGRGYIDGAKTAATFIQAPAWRYSFDGSLPQLRLYKTGDLARYTSEDGLIELLGRKDTQVKLRGQRIELEEIEHQVKLSGAKMKGLAVELIKPEGKDNMLACFIALGKEEEGEEEIAKKTLGEQSTVQNTVRVIRERLKRLLPQYMIPTLFIPLEELPTTTSLKVNRKGLRAMGASFTAQQLAELRKSSGQDGTQRLLTKAEQTMQQLWAHVLEVEAESIGPEDNFFQLGGDSITAMKLVGEARKAGLQLTLAEIFRHAQLGTFANHCVQAANESVDKITAPFSLLSPATKDAMFSATRPFYLVGDMNSIVDVLPVTYTQKYFIKKGIQNPREAFNYFSIGLEAALDTQRLKDSCRALLEHFPILRTHFCEWQRELYQVIPRQYNVPLKVFDVDGVLVDESHAIRMRDIDHIRPLGLPTSFMLVRHTSGASRLIVRLSHAQYDGVSLPVMLKSFASLYQQESLRPNLDFSRYLAYMQERHTASAHYWRQLLNGSQITRIASKLVPKMRNNTTIETIRLEKVISAPKLPTGLTTGLLVSCAWATVLSHISGNVDVVYGLVVTGRNSNLPGITEMLAPCVNFVPVRAQMSSTNSSAQLLHSLQDQFISLGESDSMGLGDIVQHCTNWPAGSEFESIVQHQNIDEQPQFQFSGENTKLEWFENPFAVPNRFSILSHPRGDGLAITIGGNTGMMTGESAQILMNMICDTISRLSGDLGTPIGSCKSSLPECTWG